MQEQYDRADRKRHLRRLDAILTALEELNLHGVGRVSSPRLVALLEEAGISNAATASVSVLIDRVLAMQQPYLVKVPMERRRRRRRQADAVTPDAAAAAVPQAS
jgi:hypothetical protein